MNKLILLLFAVYHFGIAFDSHAPNIIWEKEFEIPEAKFNNTGKMHLHNDRIFFEYNCTILPPYDISVGNIFKTDLQGNNRFYYKLYKSKLSKYDGNFAINDVQFDDDYFKVALNTNIVSTNIYAPQNLKFSYNNEIPVERHPEVYDGDFFSTNKISNISIHNDNILYLINSDFGVSPTKYFYEISFDLKDTISLHYLNKIDDYLKTDEYPLRGILNYNENELVASFKSINSSLHSISKFSLQNDTAEIEWNVEHDGKFGVVWNTEGEYKYNIISHISQMDWNVSHTNYFVHTKINEYGEHQTDTVYTCEDAEDGKPFSISGVKVSNDGEYVYLYGTKDFYWSGTGDRHKFFILIFDKDMKPVEEIVLKIYQQSFLTDILIKDNGNIIVYGYSGYGGQYVPYIAELKPKTATSVQEAKQLICISPNPASDYIEISVDGANLVGGLNLEIEIYDVLGNVVWNSSINTLTPTLSKRARELRIDVSHLPRGRYFVRIGDRVEKFVKR